MHGMAVCGLVGTVLWAGFAVAAPVKIDSVIPKGVVTDATQVVLRTSADAVALGNAQAPALGQVQCLPQQYGKGSARWNNAREWVWQFDQKLPAGTRCQIHINPAFRLPSGEALAQKTSIQYQFEIAGPSLMQTWPTEYSHIEETQTFLLQLNGIATEDSLREHVYCRSKDVGEQIPIELLSADQKKILLKGLALDTEEGEFVALKCKRRFTPRSEVSLVYGAGVQMPNGTKNREAHKVNFYVRDDFLANQTCERERPDAGCLPIRALHLRFSEPVALHKLKQVYLEKITGSNSGEKIQPQFDEDVGESTEVLRFAPPFEPEAHYKLVLPSGIQDDSGRPLSNASAFPFTIAMGKEPALAKFASAPFGVLERFAEDLNGTAVLPITVRNIEAVDGSSAANAAGARLRSMRLENDADIIQWWNLVRKYHAGEIHRERTAGDVLLELPKLENADDRWYETRTLSLLTGRSGVQTLDMPSMQDGDLRPFEVIGIPLQQPGFHVLELDSPRLGAALLKADYGPQRRMYVRTSALVTNLGVHLKKGQDDGALVWVTSLDKGKPVEGALVRFSNCRGDVLAEGKTDAKGLARLGVDASDRPRCEEQDGWFVSARHMQNGVQDIAFVWDDWQQGIESWRFNLPTSWWSTSDKKAAHTVFDRQLLRKGERVSMKHFLREETSKGLGLPPSKPDELKITHLGSGKEFKQPLQWEKTPSGGLSAYSHFDIPAAATLGEYNVQLRYSNEQGEDVSTGSFRVEEFRLPVFEGRVQPVEKAALIQPQTIPVAVSLHFINGGGAAGQQVQVSAMLEGSSVDFERWPEYTFRPPRSAQQSDDEEYVTPARQLIADKLAVSLDQQGQAQVALTGVPPAKNVYDLLLEATFSDPNGEVQTLRSTHKVWPAAVLVGLRAPNWLAVGSKQQLQVLAVDTQGKPQKGVSLNVRAIKHTTTTTRKRLVGGFYAYDNQTNSKNLGVVCSGKSDDKGLLLCEVKASEEGQIELVATAQDAQGRKIEAAQTLWVGKEDQQWFGGQDHDRMDVLLEKPSYTAGQTAKLQVRMPFRSATALVTVEREGVFYSEVMQLEGNDPVIELPVQKGWGPNVYVSVMALRGRLYEVPWYSFFTWGYQSPIAWWKAYWNEGKQYVAPTATVDLSKPAFRLGVAELKIEDSAHKLNVSLLADKSSYQVRDKAQVAIHVTRPDGTPAAHAQVALAAVDKALLELWPNSSWDLRDAMWKRRAWGVETATAQMEIVGRRHYGRKAAAPGGGGGAGAPTRELLETLLLWAPKVQLDAQGRAVVQVPLNDALTSFVITAVADEGLERFGTGNTEIRSTQDLQIISGLPPVVREGDQFQAMLTVRNSTEKPMQVQLQPKAHGVKLQAQTIDLPPQQAREVTWQVQVPVMLDHEGQLDWRWQINAKDNQSGATDALTIAQRVLPVVPLTVQQATIQQLDGRWEQKVSWPENAIAERGGIRLQFRDRLADPEQGVPGLREWWANYPYACLEQQTGKAIGLNDLIYWQTLMGQLPVYLDNDGLAMYFPAKEGDRRLGSDSLTTYLLQVNSAMKAVNPQFQLPEAELQKMESGLIAFVEGRIERSHWSPRKDLDIRKLSAIAALAANGKARPQMLQSIDLQPQSWPTHALLDWYSILQTMEQLPDRQAHLQQVEQEIRTRLSYTGTQIGFSTDAQDNWWWLMQNPEVNVARLLLLTMADAEWHNDRARMVMGLLARQKKGSWGTTTANTWGGLALRAFSQRYEQDTVTGNTTALLGVATKSVDWGKVPVPPSAAMSAATPHASSVNMKDDERSVFLPWGQKREGQLIVQHRGTGKPWVGLQSIAAVPRTQPLNAGYVVKKTITPLQGADSSVWKRGDLVRVRLEVDASADMTWVAVSDPIPAGATILGSGLGRDSLIAVATEGESAGEQGDMYDRAWLDFEERGQDSYRAYWSYLPRGTTALEYTMRLNNAGDFALPSTRVEALYAPEMFGENPNARWIVTRPADATH